VTDPIQSFDEITPTLAAVLLTPVAGFGILIDAEQCGQLIGLTKEEVQSKASKGQLPGKKFGRGWRFVTSQIVLFVAAEAAQNLQRRPRGEQPSDEETTRPTTRSVPMAVVEARPKRGRGRPARKITIPE
jgi:hypothetical protein